MANNIYVNCPSRCYISYTSCGIKVKSQKKKQNRADHVTWLLWILDMYRPPPTNAYFLKQLISLTVKQTNNIFCIFYLKQIP